VNILHLMPAADYAARAGETVLVACPPGAFIHCTAEAEVLLTVANAAFGAQPGDFVVLVIDPARLSADLRWEPPEPPAPAGSPLAGHLFPHLYGDLNREAVVQVRPAVRAPDGTFLSV
jgi:uncharacterized protein (DUF952 family)